MGKFEDEGGWDEPTSPVVNQAQFGPAAPSRRARLYTPDYSKIATHDEEGNPRPKAHINREMKAVREETNERERVTSVRKRQQWDKANPERSRNIQHYAAEQHNKVAAERPELGLKPIERSRIPMTHLYEHYGFHDAYTDHGEMRPGQNQKTLPGLEDPGAAPQNENWLDIDPKRQQRIMDTVERRSGATPASMERDYGAQLDQGHIRAHKAGYDEPHGMKFYSTGDLSEAIDKTVKDTGTPRSVVAALHAYNSPNTPAVTGEGTDHQRYPQDEMARGAIEHVRSGAEGPATRPPKSMGYDSQYQKSVKALAHVEGGGTIAEFGGLGEKTGDYMNSFLTKDTPKRLVSDVHTGGGAFHPSHGTEKPILKDVDGNQLVDENGKPKRDKSEREKIIEISGIHAYHDHIANIVHEKRGIPNVEEGQAVQWSEEKIQRPDIPLTEAKAYPPRPNVGKQFQEIRLGQRPLF